MAASTAALVPRGNSRSSTMYSSGSSNTRNTSLGLRMPLRSWSSAAKASGDRQARSASCTSPNSSPFSASGHVMPRARVTTIPATESAMRISPSFSFSMPMASCSLIQWTRSPRTGINSTLSSTQSITEFHRPMTNSIPLIPA